MKAIIKESFSAEELKGDALLVSPQSFNAVKSWQGVEVSGIKYYADKAASLGAVKPKKARSKIKGA